MIVQIYTVQSADEALAVANLGVHHIGVTPSQRGLPGEVDYATARVILAALPATVKKIALSVEEDLAEVVGMVAAVQPEVLHLCGDLAAVPPKAVSDLRLRLPGVEIMQAIPVSGPQAIQDALDYQDVADYLLLDSKSEQVTGIGATGETHDWNISRAIVQASRKPVILAGGLSSHNVAEAIRVVRPWGVDSLTHTNLPLGGGRFRKDLDAVRVFVQAALAEEVR